MRPRPPAGKRIKFDSLVSRLRGIVLLRQGKSIVQAAQILARRHPGFSLDAVRKAYFPAKGPFAFNYLVGLSRAQVTKLYSERARKVWAAHRERGRERLRRLNSDPVFAAARDKRGRERFHRLNADPEFAAAHRERLRRLNADPKFQAKKIAGLRRFWASVRAGKAEIAKSDVSALEGRDKAVRKVPVQPATQEELVHVAEREELVSAVLGMLPEVQQRVVETVFGLGEVGRAHSVADAAVALSLKENKVRQHFNKALKKLRSNKTVQELFKELD